VFQGVLDMQYVCVRFGHQHAEVDWRFGPRGDFLSFDVEAWDRCDGIVAGPLPRCSQQFISLGRRCRLFGIDLPQYLLETPSQHSSLVHLV
jgi:hypothetical protein